MTNGKLTLIGSGEFLEPMARVHRGLLDPFGTSLNAVFLDTPAGFELNCHELAERAVQYFAQRFEVALEVASYRSPRETAVAVSAALRLIAAADYIVAGPGSPTYAIRAWRGSSVWEATVDRFRNGAQLVLASAAAMASGRRAVPIYEIYRCGEDPAWVDGLDLLGPLGLDVAVMPHWNNSSGGGHDTRFCFMGEARLRLLEEMLPPSAVVVGIDELTACTMDFGERACRVEGAGSVTVVRNGEESIFTTGTSFPLDALVGPGRAPDAIPPPEPEPAGAEDATPRPAIATYLTELAAAIQCAPDEDARREVVGWIHEAAHGLTGEPPHGEAPAAETAPLIQLLERARHELRASKRFELSDEIRDRLAEFGVQAVDRPVESGPG